MGRVHKKKIAQYNRENGEGKDAPLDNSTNGDEKSSDRSRADSDADESISSSKKRTPKSTPVVDDKLDDEEEEEVIDDIDRNDKKDDSADEEKEDEDEPEVNKSTPVGKKTAQKRKSAVRSKADDDDEEEDDAEANGASPAKKSPGKKNAGKKAKAKPKSKKQKAAESEDEANADEEQDEEEEEEQEYEVKDIIDHKNEKGVSYFLIRWKGYGPNDDTWEEERTLSCQDLIEKFNKKKKATKSSKPKPASKKVAAKTTGKKDGEDPEKQWEVDKIIDYSEEKKGRVFRIRWKGYTAKFDTWEPEEHLNCDELIQKFLKKVDSQKDISYKELREEPKKTKRLVSEGFLKAEKGARKSKRGTGKQRIQYADSD